MNIEGKDRVLLGERKDGQLIFIQKPEWNSSGYWSFGWIGNAKEHYHLSSYLNPNIQSPIQKFREEFKLNPAIEKNLYSFCELVFTAYHLKEMVEILRRGGSFITKNPCSDLIKNQTELDRLNKEVLPAIFNKINDIYEEKS